MPASRFADRSSATAVFAGGSYAQGIEYGDDNNLFAQGGLLHTWRIPNGKTFLDSHLALSGWYGRTSLEDHGTEVHPQYPLSVDRPFAFYGASAQGGSALGFKLGSGSVMDLGFRCGAAYEDGPYRSFRAKAARASAEERGFDIEDCCSTGFSGMLGLEVALIETANRDLDIREGVVLGSISSNLFENSKASLNIASLQPSLSVRYRKYYFAATFDNNLFLDWGFSCALGYIIF
jgi:hypothetical protein